MIDLFISCIRLDFKHMVDYRKPQTGKYLSYIVLLILSLSMILLFYQANQIKVSAFLELTQTYPIELVDGKASSESAALEVVNQQSQFTGIVIEELGLAIRNVGTFTFERLQQLGATDNQTSLYEVLHQTEGTLSMLIFITLYLKTLPFIFLTLGLIVAMSGLLKYTLRDVNIPFNKALEIGIGLITLPAIGYVVLKVVGLRTVMAFFFYCISYILLVFYSSRIFSNDFVESQNPHE